MAGPETRYAGEPRAFVGYQTVGTGPPDLAFIDYWLTNLDVMWESPRLTAFNNRLASFSRLILYDKRGTGVSDPPKDRQMIASVEDAVDDLAVVLDEVGAEAVALVANTVGGQVAVQFAAAFPERVSCLVLGDFTPTLLRSETWPWGFSQGALERIVRTISTEYGIDGRVSYTAFSPGLLEDEAFCNWSARYSRLSCSPGQMAEYWATAPDVDVRSLLPLIQAPTMVIAHIANNLYPRAMYAWVADQIPKSRLVEVDTPDHYLWAKIRVVVRNYYEPFQAVAHLAAQAAQCARRQGRFWEYHQQLLENAQALTPPDLKIYAARIELDPATFNRCLDRGEAIPGLLHDIEDSLRYEAIEGPSLFVNGLPYADLGSFDNFEDLIRKELARVAASNGRQE